MASESYTLVYPLPPLAGRVRPLGGEERHRSIAPNAKAGGGAARATRSPGIVSKRIGRPPLNECVVDAYAISVLAEFCAVAAEVRTQ